MSCTVPDVGKSISCLGYAPRDNLSFYVTLRETRIAALISPTLARFDGVTMEDGECGSPIIADVAGHPVVIGVYCLAHARNKKRKSDGSQSSRGKKQVSWPLLEKELVAFEEAMHGVTFYHAFTLCSVLETELRATNVIIV